MLGVGAAEEVRQSMILSGLAGALADACSMAVGEFVSVSAQRDIEVAVTGWRNPETKPVETNLRLSNVLTFGRFPVMKVAAEDAKMKMQEDGETEQALPNPYKSATALALAFLFESFLPLASAAFTTANTIRIAVIAVASSMALALPKQNIASESSDRRMDCKMGITYENACLVDLGKERLKTVVLKQSRVWNFDCETEVMDRLEKKGVLPRLDRLELLVKSLEERHSSCKNDVPVGEFMEPEVESRTLSSALEEVNRKGTLIERLSALENRVLKLSLDLDIGNTTLRTSSSAVAVAAKTESTNAEEDDDNLTMKHREMKENSLKEACGRNLQGGRQRRSRRMSTLKMPPNKWLGSGWFRMGCH
ncbi:hypothetical protein SLEP1_g31793 [Rubroshorea leprosula]|uniref:Uncharacterized protein n=1 Tax=Rubroshorea leprosula TaxID=152421 RepID=A0AAV5KAW6_9ROSI|nr:hypothetical protein SLEP1_g31793 [Rubroshorea leprosula]